MPSSPTVLDLKFRALASKLLNARGKQIDYTQYGKPVYDPTTSTQIKPSTSSSPNVLIYDGISKHEALSVAADLMFMIATDLIAKPKNGDKVVIDGEEFAVVETKPVYSGFSIAMHKVFIKRK